MDNRNRDSEFCGKVPLHQTNLIQPHGILLVVKRDDLAVLQASENADAVFQKSAQELTQENLSSFLSHTDIERLASLFDGNRSGRLPFVFSIHGVPFLSIVEEQDSLLILEIDKKPHTETEQTSFTSVYQDIKLAVSAIEACTTTNETVQVVTKELKRLSGFDKVMVYCFDEQWNGDVIAEEMEPGMESYLGLKFPASDIPKQARELYKKSPYRLIPSVDYEGVKLYPVINPLTGGFTNLSTSNLRSVAAVHLEYLRNMQVAASMSTRIMKDGELWGLIACHHRTPKYLSYEMCSVFELLSSVVTAKISAVQKADSFEYKTAKQELQNKVVEGVLRAEGGIRTVRPLLMELLDAGGVALINNGQIETAGATPAKHEIEDLLYWLQANNVSGLYHQLSLASVYESAGSYAAESSGLLALPIEAEKGDYLLAFRPESVREISWGGNPDEAVQFESDGKKYHPRASFKIWQQTVRKTAQPWKPETLDAAEKLRHFLVEKKLSGNGKR